MTGSATPSAKPRKQAAKKRTSASAPKRATTAKKAARKRAKATTAKKLTRPKQPAKKRTNASAPKSAAKKRAKATPAKKTTRQPAKRAARKPAKVTPAKKARRARATFDAPASEPTAREIAFIEDSIARGDAQLPDESGALPEGATHEIVEREGRKPTIKRRRFSAV